MRRLYLAFVVWLAELMTAPVFVGAFFALIIFWLLWNSLTRWPFDRPPYMGLNLVMSALAGIQATAVAVAAKRQERHQARQAERMLHLLEAVATLLKAEEERRRKAG